MKRVINILNILGALGVLTFLLAFILFVNTQADAHYILFTLLPLSVAACGICITMLTLMVTKKAYQLFIGLALIIWSVFEFILVRGFIQVSFFQWWPLIGVFSGILIFIAGLYQYKKLKFGYFIPSLTLFLLGLWFSLFSFKIIKVSFKDVALIGGPLFMIMVCILICALFLIQQKTNQFIAKDDEPGAFEDDEISDKKEE